MCCLVDVFSVVNAKITFDNTCIKDFEDDYLDFDEDDEDSCRDYHEEFKTLVQDHLQKLRYATELTFGTLFSQVLCILQFKVVPIPELECKYLALELHLEKFSLYGAAGLLRASCLVETLNISIENQPSNIFFNDRGVRVKFHAPRLIPRIPSTSHQKETGTSVEVSEEHNFGEYD
ncbi:hypothetical protein KY284_001443 [Solanum tuberosum]|nr:hypothetical protein KY284_001443 [Solanum tuberosum]